MKSELMEEKYGREVILEDVIHILKDMISDWDMEFDGMLGPGTKIIADLGFESIDVVQFIVAIEERFKCRGLPYEEFLMVDGRYVDEILVETTVNFLHHHLNHF